MSRHLLLVIGFAAVLVGMPVLTIAQNAPQTCTLTIVVEGMSSSEGSLGVLVFNDPKGWPENRFAAFRDASVPAQAGTQAISIPDLPPGRYAVALIHDTNSNHKIDKNWIGQPKEQWGMSNSLHATLKAPPIEKAWFDLRSDKEIRIELNNP